MSIIDPPIMKDNLDEYLPHQCLFLDDTISVEDKYKKTFFYATLYLLTNNKFLMGNFLSFIPDNNSDREKIFGNMINEIYNDIINIKKNANSKKKINQESINAINDYKQFFKNEKNEKSEKSDPRYILVRILLKTMKKVNHDSSDIYKNLFSEGDEKKSKEDLTKILENLSNLNSLISDIEKSIENSSWIDESFDSEIENEGNYIVIKITEEDGSKKYRLSSYIKFYLKEEKTKNYTLKNCFKNYLDEIRHISIQKKVYYKFPESNIILLFFGKNEENIQEYKYEFEEVLDFSEPEYIDYLDEKIRNKKYILGGLVACKFPKNIYEEFFYTFYRKYPNKKNSSFYIYNSKEKTVKEVENVNNKLKKEEKEAETKSYPYILIYNEIKD